ncbi:hypothetical protein TL16_g00683 [Triparma laevis f. inornata]|uniref:LIM zinc-binding domain-containing protein n=1 Tax=Triparma laevis f. inornata TaxID=1714386 RepID=A0A9W6ZCX9_9STRA|nr:hypothetical protein TL16_g00683 [Triparma laevis f. inornata]
MSRFSAAPKCPKCSKSAYANESVIAIGQTWHIACFACASCSKGLGRDASNACDNNGSPYCKACYGKIFGPKGIGFGSTLGDTGLASAETTKTSELSTQERTPPSTTPQQQQITAPANPVSIARACYSSTPSTSTSTSLPSQAQAQAQAQAQPAKVRPRRVGDPSRTITI